MKVFLTGASGLVGSHVAATLVQEGHAVRALVRPENVLTAASDQGVRRFLQVSSVAVYGGADVVTRAPVDEESPTDGPLPAGEHYARSKRLAEDAAWRYHRRGKLALTVVRPDMVYGERDRLGIPRLARYLSSPVVVTIGPGDRELPLVYAGNVATGILAALESQRAPGRAYNLANDFSVTQREFFDLLATALGRDPVYVSVPYSVARTLAWSLEGLARLVGRGPPPSTRRNVAFLGAGNPFVSRRARRELGWAPAVDHREGVARAVRWYRRRTGS